MEEDRKVRLLTLPTVRQADTFRKRCRKTEKSARIYRTVRSGGVVNPAYRQAGGHILFDIILLNQ
jgi:hypothetical protein